MRSTRPARVRNLATKRFGRIIAIEILERRGSSYYWICECDCGRRKVIRGSHLASGRTKSCGCLNRELVATRSKKHGCAVRDMHTPEYSTWHRMKWRCANKTVENYGAKGVLVCDRWMESFEDFYKDMGKKPTAGHTIDRIDSDGDYEPNNCRWATPREQARNRSNSRYVEYYGETVYLSDLCARLGIKYKSAHNSLRNGNSVEAMVRDLTALQNANDNKKEWTR